MKSQQLDPQDWLEEMIDEDTADEWNEDRIDNIGQNGNDGEHYEQTHHGNT